MEPMTDDEINSIKRRDAKSRCGCGTKIEIYSADLSWCPKCRIQCEHVENGPSSIEIRAVTELERLRAELADVTAERDELRGQREPSDVAECYRSIIREWVGQPSELGKHEAVHFVTVRQMLATITDVALLDWVRWLVWWHGFHCQQLVERAQWLQDEQLARQKAEKERDELHAELMQTPPTLEWLRERYGEPSRRHGTVTEWGSYESPFWIMYQIGGHVSVCVQGQNVMVPKETRAAVLAAVANTSEEQ